ncbi:hypothetical protein FRY74_08320 [Vicingus serpentipes]|uniref:Class I SAM-dependent methyltransferase n=1 Tax=Vicingus serpentipes TaxID=1926625 RepID=A0A5C6RT16_9FLAO|nr:hypothetical protein [Vicingus serpentipes]TXB65418.1 hypothetical protein FRY74_08320 [Vicingus serpentipes]
MIDKIKSYLKRLEKNQHLIIEELNVTKKQTNEIEWANIYHDSIRGKVWLENLPLNVGRWAGNYSFFYVLHRILNDYQPKNILELGLGESTKIISTYLDNFLTNSNHIVVEHNPDWVESFKEKFKLNERTKIELLELELKNINGFEVNSYKDFDLKLTNDFDFYIVDGPFGADRFSRYDIISLVKNFEKNKEFIILFDDTNRRGEQETCDEICSILKKNKIIYHTFNYSGNKASTVIASDKYKFSTSF